MDRIIKSRRNKFLNLLLVCIFLFSMVLSAQAASGVGTGGGTGGTNPLNYVSANLTTISGDTATPGASIAGSTDVPADATFELQFDKNVISEAIYNGKTVYANNQTCIVLQSSSGTTVSANVFRLGTGDPTDPEKHNIFVKPSNPLTNGQQYEITVSPNLIANNGLTMGYPVTINFTVEAAQTPTPTPVVTNDDTLNTVTGMAAGMEYKLDAAGYVAYDKPTFDAIDFSGAHTLLVRVAAAGINPASDEVTLIFTANTVPVKPAAPVVTNDDAANTVTGMAAGMEYKLDAAGYVTYDKPTFDAIDFSGAHTLLVRVAAAGINPASDAVTLIFTANSVKPAAPSLSVRVAHGKAAGGTTQIKATPRKGNHLVVKVASASIATPKIGDAVPTDSGVTNPYTSGADISGVNLNTNKYIAVYEADANNNVVKFRLVTLTKSTINLTAPELNATATPGTIAGGTIISATTGAGNHLVVKVSSKKIATPKMRDAAPIGTGVINPYVSETEISGVNLKRTKYIGVYEVDTDNQVVRFKLIKLASASIKN